MNIKVKICGLTRRSDAEYAASCGADYLGFVLYEKSPRFVPPEKLKELAHKLAVPAVGVFVDPDLDQIKRALDSGVDIIQLHGNETMQFALTVAKLAPVWKAAYDPAFPAEMLVCDAARGGSGVIGDHILAAEIAKTRRIMLAGGITPDNAVEFARQVKPFGIDLASGVESAPGIKDHEKIKTLFINLTNGGLK